MWNTKSEHYSNAPAGENALDSIVQELIFRNSSVEDVQRKIKTVRTNYIAEVSKGKGKAVPLQTWSGPEDSRKLSFPDIMIMAQEDGKFVNLMHRPHLTSGNSPGTHFC